MDWQDENRFDNRSNERVRYIKIIHEMMNLKQYDPSHRTEVLKLASNPKLFVHLCGPDPRENPTTTLIVFVHGFPELGFSWRYQWRALSSLGYSLVSPDMRGYGETWVPENVEDYSFKNVTEDLVYLVKALGREKAIFIGHDFGGSVVWAMALHHQNTCLSVIGINTPLMIVPKSKEIITAGGPIAYMKSLSPDLCGHLDYQVYFQDHGEDELNADARKTILAYFRSQISGNRDKDKANMRLGMRTNHCRDTQPGSSKLRGVLSSCPEEIPRDPLWTEEEIEVYAKSFEKTGFPLKWYRAMDLNWNWDLEISGKKINFPCLMISAEFDAVLTPESSRRMEEVIPGLERKQVSCGHWTMIERKNELNEILVDYLLRRFPGKQKIFVGSSSL